MPNGDGPRDHPALAGLSLGALGQATPSAVIATKTLLFVTQADKSTPCSAGERRRHEVHGARQSDGRDGVVDRFGVGQNGTPMTYLHEGKQYVVVAVGGTDYPAELVALALP